MLIPYAFTLERNIKDVFVELKSKENLNDLLIVQTWQKTTNSMGNFYEETQIEREEKAGRFIQWGMVLSEKLHKAGYWSDLIDPLTGNPVFGSVGGSIFIDTDIGIHLLGYDVMDTGCCKILSHKTLKTYAIPGTLCTLAPLELVQETVQRISIPKI